MREVAETFVLAVSPAVCVPSVEAMLITAVVPEISPDTTTFEKHAEFVTVAVPDNGAIGVPAFGPWLMAPETVKVSPPVELRVP